jgi:hypothetical protein
MGKVYPQQLISQGHTLAEIKRIRKESSVVETSETETSLTETEES